MAKKRPVKKLEIDLTAADLEQGAHWLADKATTEFENAKPPPYQAIIKPWPLPQPVPDQPPPEVQPDGKACQRPREILDRLFREGGINLVRGTIFDQAPSPMPSDLDFAKVEGMMLGLAIGDALGNTSEGQVPAVRRGRYGEIRDYLPNRHAEGRRVGLLSDDTQLAFWTLQQMLDDGEFVPAHAAERFSRGRIFGIGSTMKQFLRNYKNGLPWEQCGAPSAGNGALMRIAPILIPHLRTGTANLWADAALCAMLTHNDAGSTAACVALVLMLWQLLAMTKPPPAQWWLETYVDTARELEGDTRYRPRSEHVEAYEGPIWRFVQQRVGDAYRRDLSVLEAGNGWYSGAYLLETVPSVIYILMRHGHDPEDAIVRAVNDTKDNDTVAAIVGATVGALHGRAALPSRWIDDLLGRTTDSDDGRVFELLESAREMWWGAALQALHPAERRVGFPGDLGRLTSLVPKPWFPATPLDPRQTESGSFSRLLYTGTSMPTSSSVWAVAKRSNQASSCSPSSVARMLLGPTAR